MMKIIVMISIQAQKKTLINAKIFLKIHVQIVIPVTILLTPVLGHLQFTRVSGTQSLVTRSQVRRTWSTEAGADPNMPILFKTDSTSKSNTMHFNSFLPAVVFAVFLCFIFPIILTDNRELWAVA